MTRRSIPAITLSELQPVLARIRAAAQLPQLGQTEVTQARAAAAEWENWCAHYRAVLAESGQSSVALSAANKATYNYLQVAALPEAVATDIPLVTIDPSGSRDLDQAVAITRISRLPEGFSERAFAAAKRLRPLGNKPGRPTFLVHYAIASTATFIAPGSPLDAGVWERGLTTYLPDAPLPLHPPELSYGAASLLPGQLRCSCLWRLVLDEQGRAMAVDVRRALVKSRVQLSYRHMQKLVDGVATPEGDTPRQLPQLLRAVGELLLQRQAERGGASARIPEQEIAAGPDGYRLVYRGARPVEEWNAQISLLTGMAAAALMELGGSGIIRTVAPASPASVAELRRVAHALGLHWDSHVSYADFIRNLDPEQAPAAAFLSESVSLYRGAGYFAFTSPQPIESCNPQRWHAAIAAEYAHATAPLRRLVDRYSSEVALAASRERDLPGWVGAALPELPRALARATQRVANVEHKVSAALKDLVLSPYLGRDFTGVVVSVEEHNPRRGRIMVQRPAVMAHVRAAADLAELPLGSRGTARLTQISDTSCQFVWLRPRENSRIPM